MTKNPKTKRTQIKDLPQTAQELSLAEATRVKGGAEKTPLPKDTGKQQNELAVTIDKSKIAAVIK